MKRIIEKTIAFIICFVIVFLVLQNILLPKHMKASTLSIEGYNEINRDSIDVLCLGASQMFCTIDAQLLTQEYGINTYDLCASSQMLPVSKYYLEYALKTQSPKLVVLEVSSAFDDESYITDQMISWSYAPMPMDELKWNSLYELFNGDVKRVIENTYLTFFQYHNRWNSLGPQDLMYYFGKRDYSHRGFMGLDGCQEVSFEENANNYERLLPEISTRALDSIAKICSENGIQLLLLKVPVPGWGKVESNTIQAFADENGLIFLDLNEEIERIGIDGKTDYANISHVNKIGAQKVTDFFGKYLVSHWEDGLAN